MLNLLRVMPDFASVNAVVIGLSMAAMAAVYGYDLATEGSGTAAQAAYLKYPSVRSSFWYFFWALTCILIDYTIRPLDSIGTGLPDQARELLQQTIHVAHTVLSNVASLSVLIAALAYARGKEFDTGRARKWLGLFAILIGLWAYGFEMGHHEKSLLLTLLLISPDVMLSGVAIILLGWAFLSRWTGVAVMYFAIALFYAFLQLPARLALDVAQITQGKGLQLTFYLLAVGKIFLIGGFVLLLRKTPSDIEEPRLWPHSARTSPYPLGEGFVALILAFAAAYAVAWLDEAVNAARSMGHGG